MPRLNDDPITHVRETVSLMRRSTSGVLTLRTWRIEAFPNSTGHWTVCVMPDDGSKVSYSTTGYSLAGFTSEEILAEAKSWIAESPARAAVA